MTNFFASLYEWFGIIPLYTKGMMERLRGWDYISQDYVLTNWYINIGVILIVVTLLIYSLQYHIIDSSGWNKRRHWWIFAFVTFAINFLAAFIITNNIVQTGDFDPNDNLSTADCIGFGFSNALWGFIFFLIISTIPIVRRFSTNCRHTTFWKP
jgi:hypothetical protein